MISLEQNIRAVIPMDPITHRHHAPNIGDVVELEGTLYQIKNKLRYDDEAQELRVMLAPFYKAFRR